MVGEFPEVQGIMGGYYARAQGEPAAVAAAIADHYRPLGPAEPCPTATVSVAVALADKLDTLVGFFASGIKPTGSKDPFALRRAALGVIRLIVENGLRLDLLALADAALDGYGERFRSVDRSSFRAELRGFVFDRLKVQQRERGVRHDLIEAIFGSGDDLELVRILARVDALQRFLETADGANLLIAYRRAANIVREKDPSGSDGPIDHALLMQPVEQALAEALATVQSRVRGLLAAEDFTGAMRALADLRPPVDRFFDEVMVNDPNDRLRQNRHRLLETLRSDLLLIADFSRIEDRSGQRDHALGEAQQ
jgi:glycyl-tRNA synthetase beta chain